MAQDEMDQADNYLQLYNGSCSTYQCRYSTASSVESTEELHSTTLYGLYRHQIVVRVKKMSCLKFILQQFMHKKSKRLKK